MTVVEPEAVVAAAIWVETYAAAIEQLKEQAAVAAAAAWESLSIQEFYSGVAVAALAAQSVELSEYAQEAVAGLVEEYISRVAEAVGLAAPPLRATRDRAIRNGADLRLVHMRPAEAYKRAIATGSTHAEALVRAGLRARALQTEDVSLRERQRIQDVLEEAGIIQYRRVVRPELSRTGTCGLCIAAADQKYSTGDLMPLHTNCKCVVLPIVGDIDPGRDMNREDLDALYADAGGSTSTAALKQTRYQVNEHGELGPVLTKAGDHFRGPGQVALEDDPPRAARMLAKMLPVLADLEARDRAGEDVSAPLKYQRDLIARLRRIAA